jgi:hypothetical protein
VPRLVTDPHLKTRGSPSGARHEGEVSSPGTTEVAFLEVPYTQVHGPGRGRGPSALECSGSNVHVFFRFSAFCGGGCSAT